MSDDKPEHESADVIRFPQSRVLPSGRAEPPRYLGLGAMAKTIGAPEHQATGHWCSRCKGIWYGYLLEVTCPACGNRHG
ncbi:hypothetical protein RFM41_14850 [Mesorhizobium sp. VK25A]|uniref:Uncharacterized protein n=1 Tax=Mesorhizobium vachelliae TaxID=3072309 RepID=A0ABU5A5X9_9HYPH|nr:MULTISPECIES: hypothetical protein [unclassified Mesorhizobium]MDX8533106.1 hypothetical protein [Mesorhizobium sp. VK25D]MDX8545025.1 hypothetical protein [Mesorhizobium sp. VK25A]